MAQVRPGRARQHCGLFRGQRGEGVGRSRRIDAAMQLMNPPPLERATYRVAAYA
jgi:hypothetical protein